MYTLTHHMHPAQVVLANSCDRAQQSSQIMRVRAGPE